MKKKRTREALKRASKFSDQDFYVQSETCYPLTKYLHYVRAVIKRRGLGISPGYFERGPRLLS